MSGQTDMSIQSACQGDFSLLMKPLAPTYDVFGRCESSLFGPDFLWESGNQGPGSGELMTGTTYVCIGFLV